MSQPTAAQDHANHVPPTHNSDGWIRCDECGGWVIHQPIKVGARFEHAHYIQGSPKAGTARPDVCTVTRVTRDQVYYRTETGMKMRRDREGFLADSVKRWLD